MTTTTPAPGTGSAAVPAGGAAKPPVPADHVTFTIDDVEMSVPKGTLVIRAAEQIGIQIPRFCDHPLLEPAGACRQCLVEVATPDREGNVRPMPKPQASCTLEATPGMVVKTQRTSPVADKAQHGIMELLLINHPLDCPVCDKGGECPLQNQAMSNGRATSRFVDVKRTFPKPIAVSTTILLDRERCVLCQRCTRFSQEIAGDVFIDLQKRGAAQQIGRFDEAVLDFAPPAGQAPGDRPVGLALEDESGLPFASYFSGNTVQICPVGALTGAAYRFRSRPFDLVSTPGVSEHDSSGSAIRVDHRRGVVLRRLAGEDPLVNEEWITDRDRFAFTWQSAPDRLTHPLVRDREVAPDGTVTRGELRPASWAEALEVAADALTRARDAGGVAVLPGGRLTVEDAYAYAKLARTWLRTNDVDHRARAHSAEEAAFLAHAVAGRAVGHAGGVTFTDLEKAPAVLLVGLEAEEEAGVTFLRLRKGALRHGVRVFSVAPFASRGVQRMHGTLLPAAPGTEAEWLDGIAAGDQVRTLDEAEGIDLLAEVSDALRAPGAVILVGERLAATRGGYSALLRAVAATGARLAWVPRRAGERGGVEAGTLPNLLPGGRPVADAAARVDVATVWGVAATDDQPTGLPATAGRDVGEMLDALSVGQLAGALVGGLELDDLPDPAHARRALEAAGVVVSLEVRRSAVTELADVVLPVAPPVEREGAYVSWEGRVRPFPAALASTAMTDHRVLDALADAAGVSLGLGTVDAVRAELDQLVGDGAWDGARAAAPDVETTEPPAVAPGTAVLAGWRLLLDDARGQDGERYLAGTAKRPVARLSAATAAAADVFDGDVVRVSTDRGAITLPVVVTDMVDHVVWLPLRSPGSSVHATLGAVPGDVVRLETVSTDGGEGA
ncbi:MULTISPECIES: NADH-quinone oxidoreductase subunit G [Cellulosimicrobium]|uniref:NADH-quinone oxidoreductase subunit G n=1 Tax=Cellulosimicrobium funkei TaxID=264251 RepID=A0A0H2KZ05_9MICO|nr:MULTISPECIES: NADH-quinone oxidoreductase subunit G [Cellulosimicrobium]KLN33182.1 NADH-quinone oxidoreductase subunit G [Cellulosimicrobium funkei]KZM77418.1 NADH-quinone oxidoreductase subunit G [Cellulosimicrobium sp. I38E]